MAEFSYTYTTLKETIQDWTEDDSTELSNELDNIIGMAELRIYREADLNVFRKEATAVMTSGSPYLAKPSDYVVDRALYITSSSSLVALKQKDTSFLRDYWPNMSTTGTPKYYADWDDNTFLVVPTPSSGLTATLSYTARPASLDGSTATTWLSTNAADLIFAACMVYANIFLKNKAKKDEWEVDYQRALTMVRDEEMTRQRRSDYKRSERTK